MFRGIQRARGLAHTLLLAILLLPLTALRAAAQTAPDTDEDNLTPVPPPVLALQVQAYHSIGPGDHFSVNLYAYEDHVFDVVVDANGEVTLKEVGRVAIGGMRIDQAEKLLEERFAEFYRSPWVDMTLLHLGRQEVLYFGGNQQTQLVEIDNGTSLFEVLRKVNANPYTSRRTTVIRGRLEEFELYSRLGEANHGTNDTDSYLRDLSDRTFESAGADTSTEFGVEDSYTELGEWNPAPREEDERAPAGTGISAMMNDVEWLQELKADPEVLSFSVDAARMFVDGNLPQYNVELKHGDIIFLESPERRVRIEGTARQGEFELLEGETLVELLILAGHISDSRADLRNVVLDRYVEGELRRAVFDLKPAGSEAAYLRDMLLEDGDVIRISPQIQQVFVLGEVNRPGVITYKQNWTVFDYLSQAGSWTPAGHEKFIAIIHHPRDLHTPCVESDMCVVNWPKFYEKEVPMSYVVLPGDVIYVPPKGEKINFSTVTSAINTLFLGVNFFNDLNTGGGTKEEPEPTETE